MLTVLIGGYGTNTSLANAVLGSGLGAGTPVRKRSRSYSTEPMYSNTIRGFQTPTRIDLRSKDQQETCLNISDHETLISAKSERVSLVASSDQPQNSFTKYQTLRDQNNASHLIQSEKLTETNPHPRWTDLTAFEGNVLYAVVRLQADDETSYGLAVKSVLEGIYDEEINHGRVYRALDSLAEYGLVKKSSLDKRTNEYKATEVGYDLIRRRASLLHAPLSENE